MIRGFPVAMLGLVRCSRDKGALKFQPQRMGATMILDGNVKCGICGAIYEIRDGILDMLASRLPVNERSKFEMRVRDSEANTHTFKDNATGDAMEVPSTLKSVGTTIGKDILEIGCGTGRFTQYLARDCKSLLAIDFSLSSLQQTAKQIYREGNVALLRADITDLNLKSESFDIALSTLYSNLATPESSEISTRLIYESLRQSGRYIVSAHHYNIFMVLKKQASSGKYDNGIFYRSLTSQSLESELGKYFSKIETKTICIWLPYLSRIKFTRVFVSKVSERIPLLKRLGALVLAIATKN